VSNRPPAKPGKLRQLVRDVLVISPGFPVNDEALCSHVRELLPLNSAADSEILAAAEWNLGEGYVSARDNKETEEREWRITRDGIARQQID
jgi:hypothetical protein